MQSIPDYMTGEHEQCDEYFAVAEQSAANGAWQDALTQFAEFTAVLEKHFQIEEQTLFPAIERVMGASGGPVMVMRMEHDQMRGLMEKMPALLQEQSRDLFLGAAETLLILMQQHNMKEEQIVYPMLARIFAEDSEDVLKKIQGF